MFSFFTPPGFWRYILNTKRPPGCSLFYPRQISRPSWSNSHQCSDLDKWWLPADVSSPTELLPTNFWGVERLRLVRLLAKRSMKVGLSEDECSMESGTISRSRISSPGGREQGWGGVGRVRQAGAAEQGKQGPSCLCLEKTSRSVAEEGNIGCLGNGTLLTAPHLELTTAHFR